MTNHRRPKYTLCLPSPMLGQNFVDSGDLAQKDLGTALPRRCEREVMVTQCDSFQSFKVILSGEVCEHNSGLASNLSKLLHVTTKKKTVSRKGNKKKVAKRYFSQYTFPIYQTYPSKRCIRFLWKPWPWVTIATIQQLHSCRKRFLTTKRSRLETRDLWEAWPLPHIKWLKLWGKKHL